MREEKEVYVVVRFDGTTLDQILGVFDSYKEAKAFREFLKLEDVSNYGDTEIWAAPYFGKCGDESDT